MSGVSAGTASTVAPPQLQREDSSRPEPSRAGLARFISRVRNARGDRASSVGSAPPASGGSGENAGNSAASSLAKHALRAATTVLISPFYKTTEAPPRPPKPSPDMSANRSNPRKQACQPQKASSRRTALESKYLENTNAILHAKGYAAPPPTVPGMPLDVLTTSGALRYIEAQWQQAELNGRLERDTIDPLLSTLRTRLLSSAPTANRAGEESPERRACVFAIMVSHALVRATHADPSRAHAALNALLDGAHDVEPRVAADAFALQIELGATGIGIDALLDIAPHLLQHDGADTQGNSREIRREALRQGLRAAAYLLRHKPDEEIGPPSLDALAQLADKALPAPRQRFNRLACSASHADRAEDPPAWLANVSDTLVVNALHAANMLRNDPALTCPPLDIDVALSYMAWRNGFDSDAPDSDLRKTRNRLFKFFTYINRAAQTGKLKRALAGFFGVNKSPLSPLHTFGTSGVLRGHPDAEFDLFRRAVGAVREQMRTRVLDALSISESSHAPGVENTDDRLQDCALLAVRIAALDQWEHRMASKGLSLAFRFSSKDRKTIEVRARALLPTVLAGGDASAAPSLVEAVAARARAVEAVSKQARVLAAMTPEHLEAWARDAWGEKPIPSEVNADLESWHGRISADVRPESGDPEQPFASVDALLHAIPDTRTIRLTSGGTYGVASIPPTALPMSASRFAASPVSLAPDAGYVRGRHAVIDLGSDEHFGRIFVGTDSRQSGYGGVGVAAGWQLGKIGGAGASAAAQARRDWGLLRGTTIRIRRGDNARGAADDWRAQLIGMLRDLRTCGPNRGVPRTAQEMWEGLARRCWKDPAFSIGWTRNDDAQTTITATAGVNATVKTGRGQLGPALSLGYKNTLAAATRTQDTSGANGIDAAARSSGHTLSASASLAHGMPGIRIVPEGPMASVSFPAHPYVATTRILAQSDTGAALTLVWDGGHIAPAHSFKETHFTSSKAFKHHIERQRANWLSALGGGGHAQTLLDQMLAQAEELAKSGQLILGEREHLSTAAARHIEFLWHMRDAIQPGGTPPIAEPTLTTLQQINAELHATLANEGNWLKESLYLSEPVGAQRMAGLSYLVNAQRVDRVLGERELVRLSAV